ncbi:hemagglutinin, partial [Salmonella enterica subsp. enterica]|nr:hemagglutinin [Salmonella enterica subsp. enterica serovar Typhimurium]
EYKVAADGSMTLTVADADGSNPRQVKLTNLASKEQQDINTTNITNNTNKIAKGLSFQGDNNVKINKQLGDTLGITGGATGALSDNNIGVVAKDGNLNVKLAKDLTGLNSVTAGSVRVGKHSDNKNYVTGLDNKEWNVQNPTITSGRAATEDQLKKVSDEIKTTNAAKTDYRLINNTNSADGSYSVENNKVDLKVKDEAHPNNPANMVTINNIASKTELDKLTERAVKYDINNGVVDKTKVTLEGANGTTITNVKDGAVTATSTDAINGSQLFKTKEELINKGMKFGADSGNVINKKLGEQVNVKGGITEASKLTAEDNIGVVSDGSNDLKVRLAKDLKGLNSVTVGDTKVTSNGVT